MSYKQEMIKIIMYLKNLAAFAELIWQSLLGHGGKYN
jgi:hypothetical protein